MTEDKTTITDNEVLARFENLPPQYDDGTPGFVHEDDDGLTWGYAPEELAYHRKWSALMPVWYKFKDLNIEDRRKNIVFERFYLRIKDAILHQGCSEACKLLAEGIRWYNSTTQNKEQS